MQPSELDCLLHDGTHENLHDENQHHPPCHCTATGESQWSLNSETMGSCLCAPTGMLTTLKRNCDYGTSTVMSSWTRANVVAHNGHDNLVQELHLWNGHVDWQHHASSVEPSIALENDHGQEVISQSHCRTKHCAQYEKLQEAISQSHCRTKHCAEYKKLHPQKPR